MQYENLGDTLSALRNFQEVMSLARKSGMADRDMAVALGNLGDNTRQAPNMRSRILFTQRLSIAESYRFRLEEVGALINIADLSARQHKFQKAISLYKKAKCMAIQCDIRPAVVAADRDREMPACCGKTEGIAD